MRDRLFQFLYNAIRGHERFSQKRLSKISFKRIAYASSKISNNNKPCRVLIDDDENIFRQN